MNPDLVSPASTSLLCFEWAYSMRYSVVFVLLLSVVGCNTESPEATKKSNRRVVRAFPEAAPPEESTEVKSVSVKVVGMMCPTGCFPQVESIIAKNNKIESVELAPQLKSDAIDNPVVTVKYRGELDKEATTKAIIEAGFESVEYTDL